MLRQGIKRRVVPAKRANRKSKQCLSACVFWLNCRCVCVCFLFCVCVCMWGGWGRWGGGGERFRLIWPSCLSHDGATGRQLESRRCRNTLMGLERKAKGTHSFSGDRQRTASENLWLSFGVPSEPYPKRDRTSEAKARPVWWAPVFLQPFFFFSNPPKQLCSITMASNATASYHDLGPELTPGPLLLNHVPGSETALIFSTCGNDTVGLAGSQGSCAANLCW